MAVQKNSGEDNLRATPKTFDAGENSPPTGQADKPRGGVQSFDEAANLRASSKVLDGKDKEVTGYTCDVPPGLQHFENDSGHPASSTKCLGR